MATSNELIEDLVTLTRGALRSVEVQIGEVRADVRVLSERLDNQKTNLERLEGQVVEVSAKTAKKLEGMDARIQKIEQAHAKYLGAAAVIGAVLGFVASLAKGMLGL